MVVPLPSWRPDGGTSRASVRHRSAGDWPSPEERPGRNRHARYASTAMTAADLPDARCGCDLRRAPCSHRQSLTARAAGDVPGRPVAASPACRRSTHRRCTSGCGPASAGFRRDDLTTALGDRQVVQGTMMRSTIHLDRGRRLLAAEPGDPREPADVVPAPAQASSETDVLAAAARAAPAFDDADVLSAPELDDGRRPARAPHVGLVRRPRAGPAVGHVGASPRRPVRPRRAVGRAATRRSTTARRVGARSCATTSAGSDRPASTRSPAGPASRSATVDARRAGRWRSIASGPPTARCCSICPGSRSPPATTPLPVRFIGTWEALLLVHARRAEILAEDDRPRIFSTTDAAVVQHVPRRRDRHRHVALRGRAHRRRRRGAR